MWEIHTDSGQMAFEGRLQRNHQIDSKRGKLCQMQGGGKRGEQRPNREKTQETHRRRKGKETEQRLRGEGHLTGNPWQEGVQRGREALAGSEAWCPPALQLPRVLGLGLRSDAHPMPMPDIGQLSNT